jgi:hypothetical protein
MTESRLADQRDLMPGIAEGEDGTGIREDFASSFKLIAYAGDSPQHNEFLEAA